MTRPRLTTLLIAAVGALSIGVGIAWMAHQTSAPPSQAQLADGTVVLSRSGGKFKAAQGFPHPREVEMDGDFLLRIAAGTEPMLVRSRLLRLSIEGPAIVRIIAHADESGEQAQVACGRVAVQKNYVSQDAQPEVLLAGDTVLINQTVDLMEKEHLDAGEKADWAKAYGLSSWEQGCP